MDLITAIVFLAAGAAAGTLIGWLIAKARHEARVIQLTERLNSHPAAQELIDTARSQFDQAAQATQAQALRTNNEQFLQLANNSLEKSVVAAQAEFERRHNQFQELVKPLTENYQKINPQIELLVKSGERIAQETSRLSSALRDNQQAGHWGEVQLKRVVEAAGMTPYCDFETQTGAGGRLRPDMIIKLPERRTIIVDAKASTQAYMEAEEARQNGEPEAVNAAWTRHSQALKRQVDDLGSKNYGDAVPGSLDFVIMFIPGDQFLAAALNETPNLIDYAISKRVAITTPASLIAMLWAVNHGWQQYRLAEDAVNIKQAGEELHKRMTTYMTHHARIGKNLGEAVSAYNSTVSSFDSRVAPQGRRFTELVTGNPEFPGLDLVDEEPRQSTQASTHQLTEQPEEPDHDPAAPTPPLGL